MPGKIQTDMLEAAAIVPKDAKRIDDPRPRSSACGCGSTGIEAFAAADLQGAGQTVTGDVFEMRDARTLAPGPADPDAPRFLAARALHRERRPGDPRGGGEGRWPAPTEPRARAERLVRYVNALLEKKPTMSLPSALEVLRTRVGDCNEHTALYVAMARAVGIPARIAVGLVHLHGAFYYHAWAEVYIEAGKARGLWLPVDPTLNQFPADATHLRLARGGLERQAAHPRPRRAGPRSTIVDLELRPGATPVLVGARPPRPPSPSRSPCRSATASGHRLLVALRRADPMIEVDELVKSYGALHAPWTA